MPNQNGKRSRDEFEPPSYNFPSNLAPHFLKKCIKENINPYYAIHMQTARKMGHVLGHTGENAVLPETKTQQKTILCSYSGNHSKASLYWILEALKKYAAHTPSETLAKLLESFDFAHQNYRKQPALMLKRYILDKPVVIPVRITCNDPSENSTHVLYFGLYKDRLIVSNRGFGGHNGGFDTRSKKHCGSKVYKISPSRVTTGWFEEICSEPLPNIKQVNLLTSRLRPKEELFLPHKPQKRGNCTVASPKALIRALLYVLDPSYLNANKSQNLLRLSSHLSYKQFTSFLRQECANEMEELYNSSDPAEQLVYRRLFGPVLEYLDLKGPLSKKPRLTPLV